MSGVLDVSERRFRAMGTDGHVIVVGGAPDLAAHAVDRIAELEGLWSRFRPDSEVSRLNDGAAAARPVSSETALLVTRAIEGWRLTGGSFDPLVLPAVVGAGYRADFATLGTWAEPAEPSQPRPSVVACTDIEVAHGGVRLPAGTAFDPGGIGKGLAADLVVDELLAEGATGVCVNLGGDLRVAGAAPNGSWTVALEHPWHEGPFALLGLRAGAVATSTTLRRRWPIAGGGEHHHLIDPATGAPSTTDVTQATVIADDAWVAEVTAKAVLLRGVHRAFDIVPADVDALVVGADGRIHATEGVAAYLGGVALPDRID